MAGSLDHILDDWSMIENMGDAYEATEELLWLVLSAIGEKEAKRLLNTEYYPMVRGEKPLDKHKKKVDDLMSL